MQSNSEYFLQQREIEYQYSIEEKRLRDTDKLFIERLDRSLFEAGAIGAIVINHHKHKTK